MNRPDLEWLRAIADLPADEVPTKTVLTVVLRILENFEKRLSTLEETTCDDCGAWVDRENRKIMDGLCCICFAAKREEGGSETKEDVSHD